MQGGMNITTPINIPKIAAAGHAESHAQGDFVRSQ